MKLELKRWAERSGKVVRWGNIIGPFVGQSFEEEFNTEEEAMEREKQAMACEPIGDERKPIAIKRRATR